MDTRSVQQYPMQLRWEYWQRATGEERLAAGWAMVLYYEAGRGRDPSKLRMRRDIARFVRLDQLGPNDH
jgi:hypothetical protein